MKASIINALFSSFFTVAENDVNLLSPFTAPSLKFKNDALLALIIVNESKSINTDTINNLSGVAGLGEKVPKTKSP